MSDAAIVELERIRSRMYALIPAQDVDYLWVLEVDTAETHAERLKNARRVYARESARVADRTKRGLPPSRMPGEDG